MKMLCSVVFAVLALQAFVFARDDDETMAMVTNFYFFFFSHLRHYFFQLCYLTK